MGEDSKSLQDTFVDICRYVQTHAPPAHNATLTPLFLNIIIRWICDCKREMGEGVELSHHRIQDRTNAFHRQNELGRLSQQIK